MKKLLFLAVLLTALASCDTKPVVIEIYPPNDTVDTLPTYMGNPHGVKHTIGE